jgi:large subunit ribosomal protein L50
MGDMVKARKFEFDVHALNARGFLRFQKPYTPPANATGMALELCRSCLDVKGDETALIKTELSDPRQKYELLTKAFDKFQHGVPNSMLHMMNTVGDIVEFYSTPVKTTTPYEELGRCDNLPPNLHVQKEPLRFHPETDTMFRGESAFPKSSTIVTGLRAKKIYRGYEAKMTWP